MLDLGRAVSLDDLRTERRQVRFKIFSRVVPELKTKARLFANSPKSLDIFSRKDNIPIVDRIHLTFEKATKNKRFEYISISELVKYMPFCHDFGPVNLGMIYEFCVIINEKLGKNSVQNVAIVADNTVQSATNAVFLIGAFMIMIRNTCPEELNKKINDLSHLIVPYCDASDPPDTFELSIVDCWRGLWKAKQLGWVNFQDGSFDAAEYKHYDNPMNADLHELVPGKFVALRGPQALAEGQLWQDVQSPDGRVRRRVFSPEYYVDTLRAFNVRAVVRLNTREYPREAFTRHGLAHADLYFQDCSAPPAAVVAKFMRIAERVPGAVAVHCTAGLGRTGTLIALFMMAHWEFAAREAMGWLRIVRPGCVIGPQQRFLCEREAVMRRVARARGAVGPLGSQESAVPAPGVGVQPAALNMSAASESSGKCLTTSVISATSSDELTASAASSYNLAEAATLLDKEVSVPSDISNKAGVGISPERNERPEDGSSDSSREAGVAVASKAGVVAVAEERHVGPEEVMAAVEEAMRMVDERLAAARAVAERRRMSQGHVGAGGEGTGGGSTGRLLRRSGSCCARLGHWT